MKVTLAALALLAGLFLSALPLAAGSSPPGIYPHAEPRQDSPPKDSEEMAELFVLVVDEEDEPVFKARLTLSVLPSVMEEGKKSGQRTFRVPSYTTDPEGEVSIDIEPGVARTLTVSSGTTHANHRTFEIPALEPGGFEEMEIILRTKDDASFSARVVDDVTGAPIGGAAVQVKDGPRGFSSRATILARSERPDLLTDDDGLLEVAAATWRTKEVLLFADGYAPARCIVGGAEVFPGQEKPFEVRLKPSTSLTAKLEGASEQATVQVRFYDHVIDRPGVRAGGGESFAQFAVGSVPTSADGTFAFEGLPAGASVELVVLDRRQELLERSIKTPEAGATREEILDVAPAGRLAGVLRDEAGEPVSGAEVVIVASSFGGRINSHDDPVQTMITDSAGAFAFEGLTRRRYTVGQKLPYKAAMNAKVLEAAVVDLTKSPSSELLELVLRDSQTIRGRVVGPDGEPAEGFLFAHTKGHAWSVNGRTMGADGSFELGPLLPGEYTLSCSSMDKSFAASIPMTASGGAVDAVVRLRRAGGISGRVVDASTGEDVNAEVSFMHDNDGSRRMKGGAPSAHFQFDQLPVGEVCVVAEVKGIGMSRVERVVVEPGQVTEGIVLKVGPAATIIVERKGRPDLSFARAFVSQYSGYGRFNDGEDQATIKVPPGPVTVRLGNLENMEMLALSVEAKAGETVTVRAADAKPIPLPNPDSSKAPAPSK